MFGTLGSLLRTRRSPRFFGRDRAMMVWLGTCVPSVVLKMLLRSVRWRPRGWYSAWMMSGCP